MMAITGRTSSAECNRLHRRDVRLLRQEVGRVVGRAGVDPAEAHGAIRGGGDGSIGEVDAIRLAWKRPWAVDNGG